MLPTTVSEYPSATSRLRRISRHYDLELDVQSIKLSLYLHRCFLQRIFFGEWSKYKQKGGINGTDSADNLGS